MAGYDLTQEDSPFQKFLSHKHGLKSFQPTLIWKVVFSRYTSDDNIIFTDSVTVPGEKVSTTQAETFIGDIVYPLSERRNTANTLTIGLYVDVYATLETTIVNDIKYFSKNGIKKLDSNYKQHIELLGYRMKGSGDSNSTGTYSRTCYVKYAFENCIPMSIDEYTYNQNNDKWGRTRNVTFVFSDYSITPINQELMEADEFKKAFDENGNNITNISDKSSSDGSVINAKKKPTIGKPQMAEFVKMLKVMTEQPTTSDFYEIDGDPYRKYSLDDDELHEILDSMCHDNDMNYWEFYDEEDTPGGSKFYDRIRSKSMEERQELARVLRQIDDYWRGSRFYTDAEYDPFTTIHGAWGANDDTPLPSLKRDSLLADLIKTAVKKYLIPDTPVYHGLMSPVSRLIRKVQEWFYTEPKYKTTTENDSPTVDSHTDGNRIRIDDDDYTTLNTHGRNASIRRIDEIDYTTVDGHINTALAEIDPNDHTMILDHQEGNRVDIDPNDYTVQNGHTESDLVDIDPNDHTTQTEHGNANTAIINPYDYTTQLTHKSGNKTYIDPNDYTTLHSHGSADIKTTDSNDSILEHQNQPKSIIPPKYDMIKDHEINEIDLKKIDANDHIQQKNHNKINTVLVNDEDYLENNKHQDTNLVNINENDFLEKGKHEQVDEIDIDINDVPNIDTHDGGRQIEPNKKDTTTFFNIDKNTIQIKTNSTMEFKTTNIIPNTNDNTMTFSDKNRNDVAINPNNAMSFDKINQNIVKKDGVSSVDSSKIKIEKIKEFFGNDTPTHDDNGEIINVDQTDSPDIAKIKINKHTTDSSLVDFAKMIIKEVKHNEKSAIGDHDQTYAHVLKRPDEPQAIEMVNRKTGNIVLVHDTDHTELT